MKKSLTLTQKKTLALVRKPMPRPTVAFKNKRKYNRHEAKLLRDAFLLRSYL